MVPSSSHQAHKSTPPIIDVGALLQPHPSPHRESVVREIGAACRLWGFFHASNHGIPPELISAFQGQMKSFFALPLSSKLEIKRTANNSRGFANDELTKQLKDSKEIVDLGGPHESDGRVVLDGTNQWPDPSTLPLFRPIVEQYYAACEGVAARILDALSVDLGVDSQVFTSSFLNHSSFLRLNHYPVRSAIDFAIAADSGTPLLGISRHTDAGVLTVLLQDDVSSLQVYSGSKQDADDGVWVPVSPVDGALTINTGDMLQIWSNDVYGAPEHRVIASREKVRFSAPFFYNPRYDADIEPLAGRDIGEPKKYKKLSWGEFRRKRFAGDYADLGKETQIEDYRVTEGEDDRDGEL